MILEEYNDCKKVIKKRFLRINCLVKTVFIVVWMMNQSTTKCSKNGHISEKDYLNAVRIWNAF